MTNKTKKPEDKYRYWDIYDELPDGWKIEKACGSPIARAVFITDGVPPLYGCKRALLRLKIESAPNSKTSIDEKKENLTNNNIEIVSILEKSEIPIFHAKTINYLARLKFTEKMLKEIMFDMKICELEGWNKMEYIEELKNIINKFGNTSSRINKSKQLGTQLNLFSDIEENPNACLCNF